MAIGWRAPQHGPPSHLTFSTGQADVGADLAPSGWEGVGWTAGSLDSSTDNVSDASEREATVTGVAVGIDRRQQSIFFTLLRLPKPCSYETSRIHVFGLT